MRPDLATVCIPVPEITPRSRIILLSAAVAMVLHFLMACALWCCIVYTELRSAPHARHWDWLPQASAAVLLLVPFVWSAWCAWRWQRRSLRLLLAGLVLTTAVITIERSFSLYQLGVRQADVGEYSVYINSFEVRGTRDRF